jgi:16S rRNA G1207 methylase RsmC
VPGVFSRRELDAGTRVLLQHASRTSIGKVERVVDLGAGLGALALWAADHGEQARVLAIDSNYLACALARDNAERSGLADQVQVAIADGLDGVSASVAGAFRGRTDLFLINPPTHESQPALERLLAPIGAWLDPAGLVLAVVNRPGRAMAALRAAGLRVDGVEYEGYAVLEARAQRSALPGPR